MATRLGNLGVRSLYCHDLWNLTPFHSLLQNICFQLWKNPILNSWKTILSSRGTPMMFHNALHRVLSTFLVLFFLFQKIDSIQHPQTNTFFLIVTFPLFPITYLCQVTLYSCFLCVTKSSQRVPLSQKQPVKWSKAQGVVTPTPWCTHRYVSIHIPPFQHTHRAAVVTLPSPIITCLPHTCTAPSNRSLRPACILHQSLTFDPL